jgi:hypothetical protein
MKAACRQARASYRDAASKTPEQGVIMKIAGTNTSDRMVGNTRPPITVSAIGTNIF